MLESRFLGLWWVGFVELLVFAVDQPLMPLMKASITLMENSVPGVAEKVVAGKLGQIERSLVPAESGPF
jgi:hypothetical protein